VLLGFNTIAYGRVRCVYDFGIVSDFKMYHNWGGWSGAPCYIWDSEVNEWFIVGNLSAGDGYIKGKRGAYATIFTLSNIKELE